MVWPVQVCNDLASYPYKFYLKFRQQIEIEEICKNLSYSMTKCSYIRNNYVKQLWTSIHTYIGFPYDCIIATVAMATLT